MVFLSLKNHVDRRKIYDILALFRYESHAFYVPKKSNNANQLNTMFGLKLNTMLNEMLWLI